MRRLIIIIFCFSAIISAQTEIDSLELIKLPLNNTLTTNFDKLLNTYSLNTRLYLLQEFDNVSVTVHENYLSTLFLSTDKSIRDEQYLSLSGAYKISSVLKTGIFGNSNYFSDDRNIQINTASVSNAALFFQVTPMQKLDIVPFAGYSVNSQVGETDNGMLYGGEGLLDNYSVSDFIVTSSFKFRNEDISPRKNLLRSYKLRVNNFFESNVFNNIDVNYSLNSKDFYYLADSLTSAEFDITNNIESRGESLFLLQDRLQYFSPANDFAVELAGRVSRRNIDRDTRYKSPEVRSSSVFDTEISENKIEFEGAGSYRLSSFSGTIRAVVSERDEKHITKNFTGVNSPFFEERSEIESQKNNISGRASVSFLGNINFSQTDNFFFSILQNKLKYDTPSEENFDDRDELLTILRFRYLKRLSPFFEVFLNTDGTLYKTVYLFSEKSSNNNVNRVLRFSAGGDYRGKNIKSLNTFEVSANYTVYDYEDLNPNYRSFSFRQFTGSDSSFIKLSNTFSASVYAYVKLSEQGDLRWASFSTKPTRFLEEIYAEPKLHLLYKKTIFSLGIRFFSLKTYNYEIKAKVLASRYASTGPLAEILYLIDETIYLKFYGWYEFITNGGEVTQEQANLNLQMIWNI